MPDLRYRELHPSELEHVRFGHLRLDELWPEKAAELLERLRLDEEVAQGRDDPASVNIIRLLRDRVLAAHPALANPPAPSAIAPRS